MVPRRMESRDGPERAGSLVVELAARTVLVDGRRVELPPTEFSLLAVLAARPGEVITHKELLKEAFGDSAYMDTQNLHWRIWNARKLIGDRDKKLIKNRRGEGFVLEAKRVEILDGLAPDSDLVAAAPSEDIVIRLEEPEPAEPAPPVGPPPIDDNSARRRLVLSPMALLIVGLIAGLALGGSWLAGFTLSKLSGSSPEVAAPNHEERKPQVGEDSRSKDGRDDVRKGENRKGRTDNGTRNVAAAPIGDVGTGDVTSGNSVDSPTGNADHSGSSQDQSSLGDEQKPEPPPPPQPDAQLYHLVNPETGDHIMTMSSSVSNQKQAEGYEATLEGGVFTSREKGTVAIGLDSGSAFVYGTPSAAPDDVSVTALYRLSSGDDFFYTTSSSAANQAQAQGWSRSTSGYVTT